MIALVILGFRVTVPRVLVLQIFRFLRRWRLQRQATGGSAAANRNFLKCNIFEKLAKIIRNTNQNRRNRANTDEHRPKTTENRLNTIENLSKNSRKRPKPTGTVQGIPSNSRSTAHGGRLIDFVYFECNVSDSCDPCCPSPKL